MKQKTLKTMPLKRKNREVLNTYKKQSIINRTKDENEINQSHFIESIKCVSKKKRKWKERMKYNDNQNEAREKKKRNYNKNDEE